MGIQRYRLEIAIKKVRGVSGLKEAQPKTAVVVQFLDFPDIVIYPLGEVESGGHSTDIRYSVSHKADFLLDDVLKQCVFPTQCFCTLAEFTGKDRARAVGRWTTVCPFASAVSSRSYSSLAIRSSTGENVGSVEMSSRVVVSGEGSRLSPDGSMLHISQGASGGQRNRRYSNEETTEVISRSRRGDRRESPRSSVDSRGPQTIRVVVREKDGGAADNAGDAASTGAAASVGVSAAATTTSGQVTSLPPPSSGPMHNRSLLSVLRYDITYQLQSTSETLAATMKREEEVLCVAPCNSNAKGILRVIDKRVQQVLKISNIVLQIANRMSDKPTNGTLREIPNDIQEKVRRNPVNKIKTPAEKSIGYYLMFDVLFQLQCVQTHLSYLLEVYTKELDMPMSSIEPAALAYCGDFEKHVQVLTKYANILIQSAIDGRLGDGRLTGKDLDCSLSSGSHSSEEDIRPTLPKPGTAGDGGEHHRSKSHSGGKRAHRSRKEHKKPSPVSSSSRGSSRTISTSSSSAVSPRRNTSHHKHSKKQKKSTGVVSVSEDISAVLPPSSRTNHQSLPPSPIRPPTVGSSSSSSTVAPPPVIYQWNTTLTAPPASGIIRSTTLPPPQLPHPTFQQRLENFSFGGQQQQQQQQQHHTHSHSHTAKALEYSSDSDFTSSSSSSSSSSGGTSPPASSRYTSQNTSSRLIVPPMPANQHSSPIIKHPPGFTGTTGGIPLGIINMNTPPPPISVPPSFPTGGVMNGVHVVKEDSSVLSASLGPHGHRAIPVAFNGGNVPQEFYGGSPGNI